MHKTNQDFVVTADKVIFFDMDGTLVDTNLANFLSYKKAIYSVTKSDNIIRHNPAKRFDRNSLKNAIPNLSLIEYERIIQEKEECYKEFLGETILKKATADILFKYSKTNMTILVTKAQRERAIETLDYHGLTAKFTKLFFKKFGTNGKQINKFENAISELGISPHLVIAFENEEIEIADAKQASIQIINPLIL